MAAGRKHRAEIKGGRQHADDGVRLVVEGERRADNRRIRREAPAPQAIAQHHRFRSVPQAFFFREHPAKLRPDPEHIEEVVGDGHAGETFRLAGAAQEIVANPVERHSSR